MTKPCKLMRTTATPALAALAFSMLAFTAHAETPPPPPPSAPAAQDHADHMSPKPMSRADKDAMLKRHFDTVDANHDGFVTRAEIEGAQAARRKTMFARIDSNGDGQISQAEFDAHHAGPMHDDHGDAPMMAHAMGDGQKADGKKMKAGHGRMGGMALMGGPAFDAADSNKDSKLSLREVEAAHAVAVAKMDSNKDGSVSRDERKAAKRKAYEERRAADKARQGK